MSDIDKEASGPSYSVVRLCESLNDLGQDSEIALLGRGQAKSYIRAFPRGIGPARLGNAPAMHRWLKSVVSEGDAGIVHNHGLWTMPNVYPGWSTKGKDVPYVFSPRGTFSEWAMASGSHVKKMFWPLIQRPSILHAACFHATAESEYEDIRRMGFRQPVAVIPNGIDLPLFSDKAIQGSRTLLFLGRLHPIKGVDILLNAWKVLQFEFPDWSLRIAGPTDNDVAKDLIRLSRNLGLQRVYFIGGIYGVEKFQALRDADLYVLPTHSENFGMTVAEALACGTPVVVTKGAPWAGIVNKKAGWWPEIGYSSILSALRSAMNCTRMELVEMGQSGRDWMREDFSWRGVAEKMQNTYLWLLRKSDKPSFIEMT
jgi:glycosyltransferase involved in cell wall biosynthesis